MNNTLRYAISAILTVAMILVAALVSFILLNRDNLSAQNRLSYYQIYEDAFKAVIVGFGVALFGVLLPAMLAEARNRFDRLKESRLAYSGAKTGVDYLPLRLCTLPLAEASAHIQSVHVQKHQSELYDELEHWLIRRFGPGSEMANPQKWADSLYDKLFAARMALEEHANQWDQLTPDARLGLLLPGGRSQKET